MDVLAEKLAPEKTTRVVHVFTFSPEHQKEFAITSVGLHELTVDEELMGTRRAAGDPIRLAYEMPKQALAEVNGLPVSLGDGSADLAWSGFHPKIRQLVMTAYAKIHNAQEEEARSFLKSQQVRVS